MSQPELVVAPSLLACDFTRVESEVERAVEAGADWLHLDLMDGHFVPNLSFGYPIIAGIAKRFPSLFLDAHLMVSNPGDYVQRLGQIPVQQITVHWEACRHLHRVLGSIKEQGIKAGVAFNPHTPFPDLDYVGDLVDCILIMTVNPGFGGQSFLESQLPKIERAREWARRQAHTVRVEVDGGVDQRSGPLCRKAGADTLVAGSYLFKAADLEANIRKLREDVE